MDLGNLSISSVRSPLLEANKGGEREFTIESYYDKFQIKLSSIQLFISLEGKGHALKRSPQSKVSSTL
jgi:hypothetical protein